MARYIHCEKCKNSMLKDAVKFNELYEFVKGSAITDLHCDGCYDSIKKGDECYAGVLLDSSSNPMYKYQKPEFWMKDFITPKQ